MGARRNLHLGCEGFTYFERERGLLLLLLSFLLLVVVAAALVVKFLIERYLAEGRVSSGFFVYHLPID